VTPPSAARAMLTPTAGQKVAAEVFGGGGGSGTPATTKTPASQKTSKKQRGGGGVGHTETPGKATATRVAGLAAGEPQARNRFLTDDDGSEDDEEGEDDEVKEGDENEAQAQEDPEEDSEDESSDDSDSDPDSSDDDAVAGPTVARGWDAMDDVTALYVAKSIEVNALHAQVLELEASGTLFASAGEQKKHADFNRRAVMQFLARDLTAAHSLRGAEGTRRGIGGGGVRSSSKGDANDSLFGGHQVGGDLQEALPTASTSRAATIAALPEDNVRRRKPSQRKKLAANDPRAQGGVLSARQLAKEGAGLFVAPLDKTRLTREAKKLGAGTAGKSWFNMPAVEYTPELRRDMRLLKLRGTYDPKRFYKTDDSSKLPKHFQVGTVIEGAQDFYSSRMTNRERKRTLTEEVAADADIKTLRKKRFAKIQAAHASTMGRKFKRKLGGRTRGGGGGGAGAGAGISHGYKSAKRPKH